MPPRTACSWPLSAGGVYASEDGATGWEPRNRGHPSAYFMPDPDPEHASACTRSPPCGRPAAPVRGRTVDAGGQWMLIAEGLPADFGFPILASPRGSGSARGCSAGRRRRARAAGGRLRVHRTIDAGATWHESRSGLPDDSWTVVLRDAACVDAGRPDRAHARTRDGCVYASADAGETFSVVAAHLPDVLVVRGVKYRVNASEVSCCSRAASPTSQVAAARSLSSTGRDARGLLTRGRRAPSAGAPDP